MKNIFLLIVVSFPCFYCSAQQDNRITIGIIDTVHSKILNEQRKIWVYVPSEDSKSNQKYPVVYLLDGDAHFYSVVGMIQQLSQVNGNTVCPEMIVVGIPNTNRARDLSPTHVDYDPVYKNEAFYKVTGGGENFISFIEKELMPYVESNYPASPYKMLVGHSLGGITVMNTLINHTHLFNSYICIDPSMWWDNMRFLKTTQEALVEKDFTGVTLYLGIANTLNEGANIKKIEKDNATESRHIRGILSLDKFIKTNKPKGLRYSSKYYGDDSHGSVPLITEYDGLRFIFDKCSIKFYDKDWSDSTVSLSRKYELHYKKVSQQLGYEVKPPESKINGMAYYFLHMKQFKKAHDLFKLNVDNYPDSFNVYNGFGDYFLTIGDKEKAMENFQKALSFKEDPELREKINKLK